MEQLRVKKRDILILNVILYLAFSFIFLYLQYAYRHHLSPFSLVYFKKSLDLFWYVSLPIVFSMTLIWRHHKFGIMAFNFCAILVGFKVTEGIFIEFNKMIVIALFCYLVIAYFLSQLMLFYFSLASLNPNYSANDLFSPILQKIPCQIEMNDHKISGFFTNWDEEGCFIKLPKGQPILNKSVKVIISFKGREFIQHGEVVAHTLELDGFGIKFGKAPKDLKIFNWSEFVELVDELGFKPERLR